jgi:hypothetical protein
MKKGVEKKITPKNLKFFSVYYWLLFVLMVISFISNFLISFKVIKSSLMLAYIVSIGGIFLEIAIFGLSIFALINFKKNNLSNLTKILPILIIVLFGLTALIFVFSRIFLGTWGLPVSFAKYLYPVNLSINAIMLFLTILNLFFRKKSF